MTLMKNFPPKRIVVAVDLSPASLAAADAAKDLARRWGSSLELVHVRPPVMIAAGMGPDAMPLPLPAPDPERERLTQRRLREAAGGLPDERVTVRTISGWPVREILDRARDSAAGLIVMGTHGSAGLDRVLLGSVAEAVVRGSRVPVLTVRAGTAPLKVERILAPWNGRPYATRALRYAGLLARSLGAELRVLYVAPDALSVDETDSNLEGRIGGVLGSGGDLSWSLRVRTGDARENIVREANSGRYGLVVVSAHRRPFSTDAVLGATAARLMRRSRIPVLAFPAGRTARAH
jgi:nucleotide-binding universal stress UspA family protein